MCANPSGVQPTTVGGEAALRFSCTPSKDDPANLHSQQYVTLYRNLAYTISFYSAIDAYASATADFDAIMQSWKWSS